MAAMPDVWDLLPSRPSYLDTCIYTYINMTTAEMEECDHLSISC